MRLVWAVAVLALGTGGCGGGHAMSGDGGNAGAGSGGTTSAGTGGGAGGNGGMSASGGACGHVPPPPSPTLPNTPGCFTKTDAGWIEQPCNCEMPLDNTTHSAVNVRITLSVDPASFAPSLTSPPAMQVSFEDPDASWSAIWSAQTDAGSAFAVTNAAGMTTVRLGRARVDLAAVPLAACQSRMGMGDVGRTANVILDLEASFTNATGAVVGTGAGACQYFTPP